MRWYVPKGLRLIAFSGKAPREWNNRPRPCAACWRCCVRVPVQASQQGGRERACVTSTSEADREQQASWGFPVVGKATGRKEASRKAAVHGLYPVGDGLKTCEGPFPTQEPAFPRASSMTQGSLDFTLLNQLAVTTNVTTRTGRKEGRKKGR